MGTNHFFALLSLVEEYAFHICETAIFLAFIVVYGNLAIRHIFTIGQKDK
jgi:intracellular septation protein A